MRNFIMGLFVGMFLGFIGAAVIVNTIAKPLRERAMYSRGVRDGMEGRFSIQVNEQEVAWYIVPIDSSKLNPTKQDK